MLILGLLFVGALSVSALGWELKKRSDPPPMDAGLFMRFALLPGERHGQVWPAAPLSGDPMVATITSTRVFALNYSVAQVPPVRVHPGGAVVSVGSTQTITEGAEPMVDITLLAPDQSPLSFRIAQSGAKALVAWAVPAL